MISKETQEKIFASMPPKGANMFTWGGKTYTVEKGYMGEVDISRSLTAHSVVITAGFQSDFRSDQSPVNNLMETETNSDGTVTKGYGERTLEDIDIRVFAKENREMRLVVDKVIDQLIGWYYTDLREIVTPKDRSKVFPLHLFPDSTIQRQIIFTIKNHRIYPKVVGTIRLVNVKYGDLAAQAYSLDD